MQTSTGTAFKEKQIRILIYGIHSQDWMQALRFDSPLWLELGFINEVLIVPDTKGIVIPEPFYKKSRTVVIPLMESHIRNCPKGFYSLIPAPLALEILSEKGQFAKYMQTIGMSALCPETYTSVESAKYPCVLKRVDLNAGRGIVVVQTAQELDLYLKHDWWLGHKLVLQSFAAGLKELVTHCICKNGHILWQVTFEYELFSTQQIRTAESIKVIRPYLLDPESIMQLSRCLIPLSYSGPCNIDYKRLADGRLQIFEINPRLGGSLMLPEYSAYLKAALFHLITAALND